MSIFTQVQHRKPKTNTFDLSHDRKMSFKMGELTPIHVQEIVPGDSIKMNTSQMLRFVPMVAPPMHRIKVYTHFFFVPSRILWDNFKNFMSGYQDDQITASTAVFPYCNVEFDDLPEGMLGDYMGLPTAGTTAPNAQSEITVLPFYAYNKIYNDYYRDQNLVPALLPDKAVDGDNFGQIYDTIIEPCQKRAWSHDYFTSALPFAQKGAEVTIPLGNITEANFIDPSHQFPIGPGQQNLNINLDGPADNAMPLEAFATGGVGNAPVELQVGATTIIDLRRAYKLQEWQEVNARSGTRYTELLQAHFNIRAQDSRLQRPEFLGGSSANVTISEVLQTSSNASEPTPQGNMAGHGISVGAGTGFSYFAKEHGYIIGIMSVLPKTAYFQGIPRHYLKRDKFDFFWSQFQTIGEQAIQNKEIYVDLDNAVQDATFGYTPRYAEYKHMLSSVHGAMRSSLDFWHMARKFANQPNLNKSFIEADPTTRIFAVTQDEQMYAHIFHRIKAKRQMAYFGSPS